MITIPLTRGMVALIDDVDADLGAFRWHARRTASGGFYAARTLAGGKKLFLHSAVAARMGLDVTGRLVDHRNNDGLDNRRENLRVATRSQNQSNQRRRSDNKTGFKGVYFDKNRRRWAVQVQASGKVRCVGRFDTPEEAARAYDTAARELHGAFARLNFPDNEASALTGWCWIPPNERDDTSPLPWACASGCGFSTLEPGHECSRCAWLAGQVRK